MSYMCLVFTERYVQQTKASLESIYPFIRVMWPPEEGFIEMTGSFVTVL